MQRVLSLLDKMEANFKQKSTLESKLRSNTPSADKEIEKLFKKARTFEEKIDAEKKVKSNYREYFF